ncbi:MAG: hypothetical protein JXR61_06775 [Prolixibacteraceae bacterium]|nr:hypothetical protein [Prolixibacteraceae bacterium]
MKQFIVKILGISAVLALIGWLVFAFFIPEYFLPILPVMLLFFIAVTILVHGWQVKMMKTNISKFARNNMLITFLKLVLYSIFAIVYIATNPENALIFVINLFILYTVFSILEVSEISKISAKK